ncbi:MAG: dihydroorotase [bacterium]|nr:dihydroorotase [bacterium]
MLESILFKKVDIVFPDEIKNGDLLVRNGKIADISWHIPDGAELVIKDSGLTLLPGVIDPHVHFREPGMEWKEDIESGSMAAASGGVTSFFEMPNTNPPAATEKLILDKKNTASEKSIVNYNFFIGATSNNIEELIRVKNIPGIKVFMGSSTGGLLIDDYRDLENIFQRADKLIAVHAESESVIKKNKKHSACYSDFTDHMLIRSPEAAVEAVKQAVYLAEKYHQRLHICHISSKDEVEILKKETGAGLISSEVTPQHLMFNAPDIYYEFKGFAQVNPPVRSRYHQESLWEGLKSGIIDCIATDHAPHTIKEKQQPFGKAPSGMPGIETALPVMLNNVNRGYCSLNQVVKWMSMGPAEIFRVYNKGFIKSGYDADLVLVDLKARKKIINDKLYTKSKWSLFNNMDIQGWPVATFVNGTLVYREGDFFTDLKGQEIIFY